MGAWRDLLDFALYFNQQFGKFTQGKMTLSMALGMFKPKYPPSRMIVETRKLLEKAKDKKNSIAVFDQANVFTINEFKDKCMNCHLSKISVQFHEVDEIGKVFLHKMLEFLEESDKQKGENEKPDETLAPMNITRLVYLLAKAEDEKRIDKNFKMHIYSSAKNQEDRKYLIMALKIFLLESRD